VTSDRYRVASNSVVSLILLRHYLLFLRLFPPLSCSYITITIRKTFRNVFPSVLGVAVKFCTQEVPGWDLILQTGCTDKCFVIFLGAFRQYQDSASK
jgi:hypothetical protein